MKKWYLSKTIWINFVSLVASVIAAKYGVEMSAAENTALLAIINIILRLVTKDPVMW